MEEKLSTKAEIRTTFPFLDKDTYDKLQRLRWLTKSGNPLTGHPKTHAERAAEKKMLAKEDPVPLHLLVSSNMVQQELTRLGVKSIALLNKTMSVAQDVMQKLRDLLDRELKKQYYDWIETMRRILIGRRQRHIGIAGQKQPTGELDAE